MYLRIFTDFILSLLLFARAAGESMMVQVGPAVLVVAAAALAPSLLPSPSLAAAAAAASSASASALRQSVPLGVAEI